MAQWLALLPYSNNVAGLTERKFCVVFLYVSFHALPVSLQVLSGVYSFLSRSKSMRGEMETLNSARCDTAETGIT